MYSIYWASVCFLPRFHEAWDLCKSGGSAADWAELGKACLVHMEVDLAIQIYRMCGNVGMVLSLQSIQVQARCSIDLISDSQTLCYPDK